MVYLFFLVDESCHNDGNYDQEEKGGDEGGEAHDRLGQLVSYQCEEMGFKYHHLHT